MSDKAFLIRQIEAQRELNRRTLLDLYRGDLVRYFRECVWIKPKVGEVVSFELNPAQRHLHELIEAQRAEMGRVRILVPKARQLGVSTYVAARFYGQTTLNKGRRTYILTHEDQATQAQFGMVRRIDEHVPELVRVKAVTNNANELDFEGVESGYRIGTARTKAKGRGETIQQFHGCLGGDVPVVSCGALVPIRDIRVGDSVTTHTGQNGEVSFKSRQEKDCLRVVVRGYRDFPLLATAEHRFWVKRKLWDSPAWRELRDIREGDWIGYPSSRVAHNIGPATLQFRAAPLPRPQGGGATEDVPEEISVGYSLGRIMGLYLAEGGIKRQHKAPHAGCATWFAVHEDEAERTVKWLKALGPVFKSVRTSTRKDSKTVVVTAYGRSFAEFMEFHCGRVDGKRLPAWWLECSREFINGLAVGYLSGDGSCYADDRRIRATSVRSNLTVGMRDALSALGYGWAGVTFKPAATRHGRKERDAWTLNLCGKGVDGLAYQLGKNAPKRKRQGEYGGNHTENGYGWSRITKIEPAGVHEVYDLEIDHPDHSYCILHGATHNSEVAFWPNAGEHMAGVMQAVPDADGTEVILESTGNGVGGLFYEMCMDAAKGVGEYRLAFLPWSLDPQYSKVPDEAWEPPVSFAEYGEAHGLEREQVYWAFVKNSELAKGFGGSVGEVSWLFRQEYPMNLEEVFQAGGEDRLIPSDVVREAVRREVEDQSEAPLLLGVDIARGGGDKTRIIDRQGRSAGHRINITLDTDDLMAVAGRVAHVINQYDPSMVFLDITGLGSGVYDRLREQGFKCIRGINFGSQALKSHRYANRRAEMWGGMAEWLKDGDIVADEGLVQDICSPSYEFDVNSRLKLEKKEQIKKRLGFSPDGGDALALTFAEPIHRTARRRDVGRNRHMAEPENYDPLRYRYG